MPARSFASASEVIRRIAYWFVSLFFPSDTACVAALFSAAVFRPANFWRGHGANDAKNDDNRNQFNQGEPSLVAGTFRMMSVRKLIHGIEQ